VDAEIEYRCAIILQKEETLWIPFTKSLKTMRAETHKDLFFQFCVSGYFVAHLIVSWPTLMNGELIKVGHEPDRDALQRIYLSILSALTGALT